MCRASRRKPGTCAGEHRGHSPDDCAKCQDHPDVLGAQGIEPEVEEGVVCGRGELLEGPARVDGDGEKADEGEEELVEGGLWRVERPEAGGAKDESDQGRELP